MTEAVKLAQAEPRSEPDPAPSEPQRQRVFLDDFDGPDLGGQWTVNNQDPEAFLVEDGKLLIVASQVSGFEREDMPNLITLSEPLPKGDWDAIVRLNGEFKTGRDQFWFGLRKDNENFLSSDVSMYFRPGSDYDYVTLRLLKHSSGKPVETPMRIHASNEGDEAWTKYLAHFESSQSTVMLSKRGRNYYASFSNDSIKGEDDQPRLWETDKLTSLRSPGLLTLGVSKWADTSGEVLTFIDSVEIVAVKE